MSKKSDKKMKERGLGRGLSALMSDVSVSNVLDDNKNINQEAAEPIPNETVESLVSDTPRSNGVTYVSIDQLERNPEQPRNCLLYTSPSPRDGLLSRMPSSA